MIFTKPKSASDFLKYVWKIIDLPEISENDLVFKMSFDLFLFPPEKASLLIRRSIEKNFLLKDVNGNLKLSKKLEKDLKTWQNEKKEVILNSLHSVKKLQGLNETEKGKNFLILLDAFLDKGTLNRAATVSNDKIEISLLDLKTGIVKAKIMGSKEEYYNIDINIKNKKLIHDCQDFKTRRAENKKFCKHIAKLFLFLKEKDEKATIDLLHELGSNIEDFDFLS